MENANLVPGARRPALAAPTVLIMQTACSLAGGLRRLADHLGVRATSVARWLSGKEKPPATVFMACVDIVLLHERHLLREGER